MNIINQICYILIGIFMVYTCMYFILVRVHVRAWVLPNILLRKIEFCLCAFIVGQYLFQLNFIVVFDRTLN